MADYGFGKRVDPVTESFDSFLDQNRKSAQIYVIGENIFLTPESQNPWLAITIPQWEE